MRRETVQGGMDEGAYVNEEAIQEVKNGLKGRKYNNKGRVKG